MKSLKYKHQLKAEQLQLELSTADLVLVFQSSHWTMSDSLRLEKESERVFEGGQKVSYHYFRGCNSIYRRLVSGVYSEFLHLLSGPSFILGVKWKKDTVASAHTGLACLRGLFSDESSGNGKSGTAGRQLPFYKVVGCLFEGRLLGSSETEVLLGMNGTSSSEWAQTWSFENTVSEGEALRPFMNQFGGSYQFEGGRFLDCLDQISKKI